MHANIELKFHLRNHNTLSYRNSELYVATFANKGEGSGSGAQSSPLAGKVQGLNLGVDNCYNKGSLRELYSP